MHLIRSSLADANWRERKALAAIIKPICTASSLEAAVVALDAFEASVVAAWRNAWERVIPFFAFPPAGRPE